MVFMIHIAPISPDGKYAIINHWNHIYVVRIAVPFFFVSSGFFLYKKTTYENFDIKPIKDYVLKLLRLYIIWSIVYLPLVIIGIINSKKGIIHGILGYTRNFLFVGSYLHLWYLNATILAVLIVSFLLYKKCKIKNIIITAIIFYVLGLFEQSWFGLIKPLSIYFPQLWMILKLVQKVIITTRNGLFEGFLFISIGMLFAFFKIEINMKKAVCGFVISFLLMFFEVFFVQHFHLVKGFDMYIFLVPTIFFLFYIAKNAKLKDNRIYPKLRQLSSLIFYTHLLVETIVSKLYLNLFNINSLETSLKFIIVLSATIAFSLGIIELSKCKYFHWLKKIYN